MLGGRGYRTHGLAKPVTHTPALKSLMTATTKVRDITCPGFLLANGWHACCVLRTHIPAAAPDIGMLPWIQPEGHTVEALLPALGHEHDEGLVLALGGIHGALELVVSRNPPPAMFGAKGEGLVPVFPADLPGLCGPLAVGAGHGDLAGLEGRLGQRVLERVEARARRGGAPPSAFSFTLDFKRAIFSRRMRTDSSNSSLVTKFPASLSCSSGSPSRRLAALSRASWLA